MFALAMAHYLHLIRRTKSIPRLSALAREIAERFPEDDATSRLTGVVTVKVAQLARTN
jgi:hypothetical protein